MENLEDKLKTLLKDFNFAENELLDIDAKSFFGTKQVVKSEFRTQNKSLVLNSGVRHFYVSSVMYKDDPDKQSFRYMIIWTVAKIRNYKCKNFWDFELNKVFISGKSDQTLIENLKNELENGTI